MQFDFFKPLFDPTTAATTQPAQEIAVPEPVAQEPVEQVAPEAEAEALDENHGRNGDDGSDADHFPPAAEDSQTEAAVRVPVPKIEDLRAKARDLLQKAGAPALAERMILRWNPRLQNTAGMAYPGRSLITLNPKLAIFGEDEIDRTLRHELGHLLAHERAGRRRIDPHGKEWRQACADLGLPGESRTHNLPLPRKTIQPRHFYQCPGCGFVLKRVQPLKRKSACIRCCRTHARGRYDTRFVFKTVVPVPPTGTSPH